MVRVRSYDRRLPKRGTGLKTGTAGKRRKGKPRTKKQRLKRHRIKFRR